MMKSTAFTAGIKLGVQGVGTQRFQNLILDCVQAKEVSQSEGEGYGMHGPLMNILLIHRWWGNRKSTSSNFLFQPLSGLCPCGQQTIDFFHLVEVSLSAQQLKGHDSEYYL